MPNERKTASHLSLAGESKEEQAVRYAKGVILPDDDDSHLSDYCAITQGQTAIAGLHIRRQEAKKS